MRSIKCLGFSIFVVLVFFFLMLRWDYDGLKISSTHNLFDEITPSDCSSLKETDVHIVYITDINYLYPTQVSMFSAIQNKCPQSDYYFHVITDHVGLKKAEQNFLHFSGPNVHVEILPINALYQRDFPKYEELFPRFVQFISATALLKLYLPEVLSGLDRAIFLDSDTLVLKDLQELFVTDLGSNIVAGVPDIARITQKSYLDYLGFNGDFYYNAGVLVLDLKQMRQENITQQLINYAQHRQNLWFVDQDVLNMVLQKRIKKLSYKYNCGAVSYVEADPPSSFVEYLWARITRRGWNGSTFIELYADELPFFYRKLFQDVVVLHYLGGPKPWQNMTEGKRKKLYSDVWRRYANQLLKDQNTNRISNYIP